MSARNGIRNVPHGIEKRTEQTSPSVLPLMVLLLALPMGLN
jgi:hypothetical protein